jgi:predicted permease
METLLKDIRYGARGLLKRPAFTLVAVITLAIGIGATTTIFSVINGVLLRPPAGVVQPGKLVDLHATESNGSSFHSFSYPDYQYYRDQNGVLNGLAAYTAMPLSMNAGAQPERIFGMTVSGNYFDVLGTRPAHGRFFLSEEDQTPDSHPVVVIGYGTWQQRFASDPALIGKTIALNGHPFTVIGIAPENFKGTWAGLQPDVWVPLMMQNQLRAGSDVMNRGARGLEMIGRLKEGVTLAQAQASMSILANQLAASYPETNRGQGIDLRSASTVPGQYRGPVIGFMAILMFIVGLVLLIACANVGAMTLARASTRSKEIAIRLAVGASRARIVKQLLVESVFLFLLGGAAGVLIAVWATRLLLNFKFSSDVPVSLDLGVDVRVLLFTLGVSLVAGLLFGLAPAVQASRPDVLGALNNETSYGSHRSRIRNIFVIGQIAVSLVLLVTAGLFLRSLQNATTIDLGFNPEGVETVTFDLRTQGYSEAKGREFYRQLMERVSGMPGVRAASLARMVPLNGSNMKTGIAVAGKEAAPDERLPVVGLNVVDERYFETLQMPLLIGRAFNPTDKAGTPRVAIVNETLARRFFPNADISAALGQGLSFETGSSEADRIQIVGIVRDAKYETVGEDPQPFVYRPLQQSYTGELTLHIRRESGDAGSVLAAVRREVGTLDKDVPMLNVMTLNEQIGYSLLPLRVAASIAGSLGMVGMLLAALGVFGVVNYSVLQRTREIGIRMSLGAQRSDVLRLIVTQGLWLAIIGIAVGVAMAAALTRTLSSLLYGVSALEPVTFIGVALLMMTVALLASYIPARRATKVDPLVALRYE